MFSLLLSDGIKGQVLETSHLRLQKLEVHDRSAAVVLSFDILHAWTFDTEDRHPSAIDSADDYLVKLSSSNQSEGSEEEVIGLEHGFTSFPLVDGDGFEEESWIKLRMVEGNLLSSTLGLTAGQSAKNDLPSVR